MGEESNLHPEIIFEELLKQGGNAQKIHLLKELQSLCLKLYTSGEGCFTISSIGKRLEVLGLMKARTLYNKTSKDYCTLIQAWSFYAGPINTPRESKNAKYSFLTKIDDPAIRTLVGAIINERDKLKNDNNELRSTSNIVIDRRIQADTSVQGKTLSLGLLLTESEIDAIRKSIDVAFIKDQGWKIGAHGEIRMLNGRIVFDYGFETGIKKILDLIDNKRKTM